MQMRKCSSSSVIIVVPTQSPQNAARQMVDILLSFDRGLAILQHFVVVFDVMEIILIERQFLIFGME